MSAKLARLERKAVIVRARIACVEGRVEDARALFASVGISYITASEVRAALEGN